MLIGIDASRANREKKTGVEWYAYHLLRELQHLPEQEAQEWNVYTDRSLEPGLAELPKNWHERYLSWPPRYAWTQLRLSFELWRHPPNTLFIPVHVLPRVLPSRTVVTVHDVGFFRYPNLYTPSQNRYQRWSTKEMVKRAQVIITVSEYSRQELLHFCDADPEKIFVTHLGVDPERYRHLSAEQAAPVLETFKIPTPFFVYVGRLEAKKNILLLLEAFHRYKADQGVGDPYHLVLAGVPGAHYDDIARVLASHPDRHVIHEIGYVSEEQKIALLSTATALIHPAWYEGFGFTPLEAMLCDCPVLCSRVASLPEVVGVDRALWFDPADPEGLTHAMTQIVQHEEVRRGLILGGRVWASRYSWAKTAEQTFRLLTNG